MILTLYRKRAFVVINILSQASIKHGITDETVKDVYLQYPLAGQ